MTNNTMPKWLQYEKRKPYHYLHVCTSMTTRAPYKNMTLGYSTTTQLSSFSKYINYTVHNLIMPSEY